MIGENGERTYDAGDTGNNVFAIPTRDQDTLLPPKVFSIQGEEPSTKFYIRLDGEFVCKVKVDRGAWGEYDDNPINVMDWQQIMLEVRKFAGRAFVLHVEIKLNHQLERGVLDRIAIELCPVSHKIRIRRGHIDISTQGL